MIVIEKRRVTSDTGALIRRKGREGAFVTATTLSYETADDFEEVTAEQIEAEAKEREDRQAYEAEVDRLVRRRYTVAQELALLRQRDRKTQEFAEYDAYVESCKKQAKQGEESDVFPVTGEA